MLFPRFCLIYFFIDLVPSCNGVANRGVLIADPAFIDVFCFYLLTFIKQILLTFPLMDFSDEIALSWSFIFTRIKSSFDCLVICFQGISSVSYCLSGLTLFSLLSLNYVQLLFTRDRASVIARLCLHWHQIFCFLSLSIQCVARRSWCDKSTDQPVLDGLRWNEIIRQRMFA